MSDSIRMADHYPVCSWQRTEDGQDNTNCGGIWELLDGTPPGHGMKYCPFCGKSLVWSDYNPEVDEDDEPPEPDGECFRGGEYAASVQRELAEARKLK